MRPTCVIHAVWRHFILVPSTSFSQVPWSVLWLRHQFVTDVTAWLINPNLSCSKNRKRKEKKTKNKIQEQERIKTESSVNNLDNRSIKLCKTLDRYWSWQFFYIYLLLQIAVAKNKSVRVVNNRLVFILFIFNSFYLFIFFILDLDKGVWCYMIIASFPLTTILYGSAYWKVCE